MIKNISSIISQINPVNIVETIIGVAILGLIGFLWKESKSGPKFVIRTAIQKIDRNCTSAGVKLYIENKSSRAHIIEGNNIKASIDGLDRKLETRLEGGSVKISPNSSELPINITINGLGKYPNEKPYSLKVEIFSYSKSIVKKAGSVTIKI